MLIAILLAGLTGFFASRKKVWPAVFCGMMFVYFLWLSFIVVLNALFVRSSTF